MTTRNDGGVRAATMVLPPGSSLMCGRSKPGSIAWYGTAARLVLLVANELAP